MLKAVLHSLASSESSDFPFLVVLILSVWEDTPWNSAAIRGHHNMSALVRIPAGHMWVVPERNQSIEATLILSPAKWLVEIVLIFNAKGQETFICHGRIHQILSPAIQSTCLLTPAQILFFPTPPSARGRFGGRLSPLPRRALPTRPATPAHTSPHGPVTPPSRIPPNNNFAEDPTPWMDTHPTPPTSKHLGNP